MTAVGAIRLAGVTVERRGLRTSRRVILEDLSLSVEPGQHVAIAGANGAGKTSLLLALVGALEATGTIEIDGITLSSRTLKQLRTRTGFVFAEPADQLFTASVFDEVAFGPRHDGQAPSELTGRVTEALSRVALSGFEDRHPADLSLGQQRRLALAAALCRDVRVILCDEPTASLDPVARRAVIDALSSTPQTLLVATHDLPATRGFAGRLVLLKDGRIVADGPTDRVLEDRALLERAGLA